ncbi:hypothetical protein ACQPZP_06035 [Spirillospora sp. CA-142024]|uniref:hypothetical protein n=1 Tax=Spirillospora sp. CA-142024 TaxID=3240036 RepID=UPI003D8D95AB
MYYTDDGSIDFKELANELANMLHGYPYGEPPDTLGMIANELGADPGSRQGRAMMVAAYAGRWYVKWQITEVSLFDDLIDAASRAGEVYGEAVCPSPGEHKHPVIRGEDPEGAAEVMALIGDPEAWKAYDGFLTDEGVDLDAMNCSGFLAGLAAQTVADLTEARKERFEAPTADPELDARYLTGDGRTNLDAVLSDIERQKYSSIDPTAEKAAVWAARRLLGDALPEERAPLALAVAHLAQHCYWGSAAPSVAALYNEALKTFDLSALDRPCPHPDGHDVQIRDTPRHARSLVSPPEDADEHGRCPRRVAKYVQEMIDYTEMYASRHQD